MKLIKAFKELKVGQLVVYKPDESSYAKKGGIQIGWITDIDDSYGINIKKIYDTAYDTKDDWNYICSDVSCKHNIGTISVLENESEIEKVKLAYLI